MQDDRPPTPILGAALICAFGIYVPMPVITAWDADLPLPIVRGAIFCLFPGIAHRSIRLGIRGALLGALFEILYTIVWCGILSFRLNIIWDPRGGYNEFLAFWLPGRIEACTHTGSCWPRWLQFGVGVTMWFSLMLYGWRRLWLPRLTFTSFAKTLVIANLCVVVACAILWVVSPMDHWCHWGRAPFGDLDGFAWMAVFLSVFPLCTIVTAIQFRRGATVEKQSVP